MNINSNGINDWIFYYSKWIRFFLYPILCKIVLWKMLLFFLFPGILHLLTWALLKVFSWKINFLISVEFTGLIVNVPLIFCWHWLDIFVLFIISSFFSNKTQLLISHWLQINKQEGHHYPYKNCLMIITFSHATLAPKPHCYLFTQIKLFLSHDFSFIGLWKFTVILYFLFVVL